MAGRGGSIGFIASARAGLLVAPDPDDELGRRRILAPTKANLAELGGSLAYGIEATPGGVARIVWYGSSEHTAKSLLAVPTDGEERSAVDEAKEFLREVLREGPVEAREVLAEAREAGISERTLKRAKAVLGVEAVKTGGYFSKDGPGGWRWQLPEPESRDSIRPGSLKGAKGAEEGQPSSTWPSWPPSAGVGPLQAECSTAAQILALAAAKGFPKLPLRVGISVGEGPEAWEKASRWLNEEDARTALEALAARPPL